MTGSESSAPGDRPTRTDLLGVKLRALVADHLDRPVDSETAGLGPAVGLIDDRSAWVLVDGDAADRLGPVLAWAIRRDAERLHILGETGMAVVARRAEHLRFPVTSWQVDGRTLTSVDPAPLPEPVDPDPAHLARADDVIAAGADLCVEHGVVTGEVRGLEVCRVVEVDGEPRLEIGVGAHDREAFALLHGGDSGRDALARVVAFVERHRRPGADHHPLNRLATERYLRWRLLEDPGIVDAVALEASGPPVPRRSVADAVPCVAIGRDSHERDLVVVCSTGTDLDLAPFVTDVRRAVDGRQPSSGGRRLVIAVPRRQRLGIVDDLVAEIGQLSGWSDPELVPVD